MKPNKDPWEPLQWNEWRETAITVHLFTQVIGKIRLGLMPVMNEWAQVPLTLTSKGISSLCMPAGSGSLDIEFDFYKHSISFIHSTGGSDSFSLKDISVAEFYIKTLKILNDLGVDVKINPKSVELDTVIRIDTDEEHNTYDGEFVKRWWQIMIVTGNVFNKFKSCFSGKQFPVNFFWGSFDLSVTFFSGKIIEPDPSFDLIFRVAMDAEQITIGFWPGSDIYPEPVYFAYTYPKPEGIESIALPLNAEWSKEKGEFILPYESVRNSDDPEAALMEFCEVTYKAGVKLAGWETYSLEHKPPIDRPKK